MTNSHTKVQQEYRTSLVELTREMLRRTLDVKGEDDSSILATYKDFLLHIGFTDRHPLMVVCLCKPLDEFGPSVEYRVNEANIRCVLGCNFVNKELNTYTYRTTHWLEKRISTKRFYEILDRCVEEARQGYKHIIA